MFLSLAGRIHVEHDDGEWAAFIGVGDEGVHGAVTGWHVNVMFDHDFP
jgi:hypothetical protein